MFFLLALLSVVNSQSKYVVYNYATPLDTAGEPQAFPIGVCVNTKVALSGFNAVAQYGMFECNTAGDQVTLTEYGADDTCSGSSTGTATVTDTSLFECNGNDNYVVTDGCSVSTGSGDSTTCCVADCIPVSIATDVCVDLGDGTYRKVTCDATSSSNMVYTSSDCSGTGTEYSSSTEDSCGYFTTQVIYDIYLRMHYCYENGAAISDDTYCGTSDPTTSPSAAPTQVTAAPTTAAPTQVTAAPTTAAPTPVTAAPTTTAPTTSPTTPTTSPTAVTAAPTTPAPTVASGASTYRAVFCILALSVVFVFGF